MLDIRPNCENCNKDLPVDSEEARICSYECTFCDDCARHVLENVCPNCGGGFVPRPIRPNKEWRSGISRHKQPVVTKPVLKPVDRAAHAVFALPIKDIAAQNR